MTLLHSLKGREKLEEGPIVLVVAGQSDEGDDRVAERLFVEDCSIAEDDALALQLVDALGHSGRRQAYATTKFRERKPGIGGKLPHNVVIDGIKIISWRHNEGLPQKHTCSRRLDHEEPKFPKFGLLDMLANMNCFPNDSTVINHDIRYTVGFSSILE
jgi:hypothetical protein